MRNNQGRHQKKPTSTLLLSHTETETHGTDVVDHGRAAKPHGVDVLDVAQDTETHVGDDIDTGPRDDK